MGNQQLNIRPIREFFPVYEKAPITGHRFTPDYRIGNNPIIHGSSIPTLDKPTKPSTAVEYRLHSPASQNFPLPKVIVFNKVRSELIQTSSNPLDQLSFGARKFIEELHQSFMPYIVADPIIDYVSELNGFLRCTSHYKNSIHTDSNNSPSNSDETTGNLVTNASEKYLLDPLEQARSKLLRTIGEKHLARLDEVLNCDYPNLHKVDPSTINVDTHEQICNYYYSTH